jgi:antirestriction protein
MTNTIKIYVADLAAYNDGILHGVWIDATLDVEEMQEQVDAMLKASRVEGAEEYAIHDHEGFGDYSLGECAGFESAHRIAEFLTEFSDFGAGLLAQFGGDLDDARKAAEDDYCGCYKSLADYAQELTEERTTIPRNLAFYIDYDAMARDMELNGDVFTIVAGFEDVHIFWNR